MYVIHVFPIYAYIVYAHIGYTYRISFHFELRMEVTHVCNTHIHPQPHTRVYTQMCNYILCDIHNRRGKRPKRPAANSM